MQRSQRPQRDGFPHVSVAQRAEDELQLAPGCRTTTGCASGLYEIVTSADMEPFTSRLGHRRPRGGVRRLPSRRTPPKQLAQCLDTLVTHVELGEPTPVTSSQP